LQTGSGQNPARQGAINAGIIKEKTATTINQSLVDQVFQQFSLGFNSLKLDEGKYNYSRRTREYV
jgi:Thiolase, N-terminal domain.